jgi:hypothetical protein
MVHMKNLVYIIAICLVLPTASLPGSYSGGVLCHAETLHVTLQPDHHGYGLSVLSPDSSCSAVIINNIDPGGPADRYSPFTLLLNFCLFTPRNICRILTKKNVYGISVTPSYLKKSIYIKCCPLIHLLK